MEHIFLLQTMIEDCKRRKKDARIVWLDLKNAFGSVAHDALWTVMERLGVPEDFIGTCKELYEGSSLQLKGSRPIPVRRGIKQGCPLSPILFNLMLEGVFPYMMVYAL